MEAVWMCLALLKRELCDSDRNESLEQWLMDPLKSCCASSLRRWQCDVFVPQALDSTVVCYTAPMWLCIYTCITNGELCARVIASYTMWSGPISINRNFIWSSSDMHLNIIIKEKYCFCVVIFSMTSVCLLCS